MARSRKSSKYADVRIVENWDDDFIPVSQIPWLTKEFDFSKTTNSNLLSVIGCKLSRISKQINIPCIEFVPDQERPSTKIKGYHKDAVRKLQQIVNNDLSFLCDWRIPQIKPTHMPTPEQNNNHFPQVSLCKSHEEAIEPINKKDTKEIRLLKARIERLNAEADWLAGQIPKVKYKDKNGQYIEIGVKGWRAIANKTVRMQNQFSTEQNTLLET